MLAMLAQLEPSMNYKDVSIWIIGAGLAALAILRWRDKDVKAITEKLEGKLRAEFKEREEATALGFRESLTELRGRLQTVENKLGRLENGSIAATMDAVEIKATTSEDRTRTLAAHIIDSLSLHIDGSDAS